MSWMAESAVRVALKDVFRQIWLSDTVRSSGDSWRNKVDGELVDVQFSSQGDDAQAEV